MKVEDKIKNDKDIVNLLTEDKRMKSKLATAIISFVICLIIVIFVLFGLVLLQELETAEVMTEQQEFETSIVSDEKIVAEINTEENIKTQENAPIKENPLDKIEKVINKSEKMQFNNYDNINVNKFFYNQLNECSKTIYRALEANKENMKTGTYSVEFGNNFVSVLNLENGQELLVKYYQSAIEAYTYDNPDVFYLSPNKMCLNTETTTKGNTKTYNVFINQGERSNYLVDEFYAQDQVNSVLAVIENKKNNILQNATGNTYNDIKMVHDYLISNVEYDKSLSKDNIYNIYGALVKGEAVCEGYARSFKYLMDCLDIPCTLVIGKGVNTEGNMENHAWNYVKLNESWYAVDCTWDDPIIEGVGWIRPMTKYNYFLKGLQTMSKAHFPSGYFTENGMEFSYPDLNSADYKN